MGSYAEMLSLPGYSFQDHYKRTHRRVMPELIRPTRREVAAYYSAYPKAAGISSEVFTSVHAQRISQRPQGGFTLQVHHHSSSPGSRQQHDTYMTINCTHLILATGIYSRVIPPPPVYFPLLSLSSTPPPSAPLLVVGSGFTAADVMMAAKASNRKILHIFKWSTACPSPLKGCHSTAYPEYAQIYRRMKGIVAASTTPKSSQLRDSSDSEYEGFPNAQVMSATPDGRIHILTTDGEIVERIVGDLRYCVGRRGSLEYLSPELRKAVGVVDAGWISADTMRWRVEEDLEVAKGVFVVGSLTGDSLVRFGFGGGVYAAGKITSVKRREGEKGARRRMEDKVIGSGVETVENRCPMNGCVIT